MLQKISTEENWEKVPREECQYFHRHTGLFLSVYVDDIKMAGKHQNLFTILLAELKK